MVCKSRFHYTLDHYLLKLFAEERDTVFPSLLSQEGGDERSTTFTFQGEVSTVKLLTTSSSTPVKVRYVAPGLALPLRTNVPVSQPAKPLPTPRYITAGLDFTSMYEKFCLPLLFDGFSHLTGLLSHQDQTRLKRMLRLILTTAETLPAQHVFRDYYGDVKQVQYLHHHYPTFSDLAHHLLPVVAMATWVPSDQIEVLNVQLHIRPHFNTGRTPGKMHQDNAYIASEYGNEVVTIWIPLQPTDLSNGVIEFIPGSHKGPTLVHTLSGRLRQRTGVFGRALHLDDYPIDAEWFNVGSPPSRRE